LDSAQGVLEPSRPQSVDLEPRSSGRALSELSLLSSDCFFGRARINLRGKRSCTQWCGLVSSSGNAVEVRINQAVRPRDSPERGGRAVKPVAHCGQRAKRNRERVLQHKGKGPCVTFSSFWLFSRYSVLERRLLPPAPPSVHVFSMSLIQVGPNQLLVPGPSH
jgi:hypothetical protein